MSDLFNAAVDWTEWASRAEPRSCAACGTIFSPNHPRRVFCGGDHCSGRRPPSVKAGAPRKRLPTGRQQAAARTAGIQGFLGTVLVEANGDRTGTPGEVVLAAREYIAAERRGAAAETRSLLLARLCASAALRSIVLVPPKVSDDDDDDDLVEL